MPGSTANRRQARPAFLGRLAPSWDSEPRCRTGCFLADSHEVGLVGLLAGAGLGEHFLAVDGHVTRGVVAYADGSCPLLDGTHANGDAEGRDDNRLVEAAGENCNMRDSLPRGV